MQKDSKAFLPAFPYPSLGNADVPKGTAGIVDVVGASDFCTGLEKNSSTRSMKLGCNQIGDLGAFFGFYSEMKADTMSFC